MANKKQELYKAEYRKARRNLMQNIRRLEKRGYDTSNIIVPQIPEGKIKKSDINAINKLNNARYDLSTKTELITKRMPSGEKVEVLETVSGKIGRRYERKRAGAKAGAELKRTRKLTPSAREDYKYLKKKRAEDFDPDSYIDPDNFLDEYEYRTEHGEKYETDWRLDDEGMAYYTRVGTKWFHGDTTELNEAQRDYDKYADPYYDEETGMVFDPRADSFIEPSELDFEKNVYFANAETGEIIERPYGSRRPKDGNTYYRIMPPEYNAKMAYEKAMQELEIMANYQGDSKHGRNAKHDGVVRYNAQAIKEAIERMHDEFPSNVENAIYVSNYMSDYHSVEFMYRNGGYERYVSTFAQLAKVLGLDIIGEMDEDYDEGNYDY